LAGIAVAAVVITGAFGQVFHSADILDLQSIDRVTALGLNPNYLGLIFSLAVVAIAGVAANRRNPLLLAATIPCWVALGETKSRGSIFVIGVGLLFVYLFGRGILTRISIVGGILITVLVSPNVVSSFFGAILGARASVGFISDTSARVDAAKLAVKLSFQHPLLGIGYGNFLSHAATSPTIGVPLATHDDYLRVASEAGIPALVLLLALIAMGILAMRRIPNGNIGIALIAAYCAALFTENTLSNLPITIGFWVLIGSAIGIDSLQSSKNRAVGEPKELSEKVG
jgi:O-antigen ligase